MQEKTKKRKKNAKSFVNSRKNSNFAADFGALANRKSSFGSLSARFCLLEHSILIMMKKYLLCLTAMLALASSYAFAEVDEITEEHKGYHPYKEVVDFAEPNAFWSLYIDAGFSHFDGDRTAKLAGPTALKGYSPELGIGVEYSFTPLWGVWVDYHSTSYGQYMFDKTVDFGATGSDRALGNMNTVGVGLSFNLMNAFFPRRKATWLNFYVQAGGGLGVYSYHGGGYNYKTVGSVGEIALMGKDEQIKQADGSIKYGYVANGYTDGKGTWIPVDDPDHPYDIHNYNTAAYLNLGALLQFNLTRSFELGLRAYYDYFTNDNVDGNTNVLNPNNKNNDGIFALDLQARWCFSAKKDSHTRNYASVSAFDAAIAERKAKKNLEDKLDSLANRPNMKDTIVMSRDTVIIRESERVSESATGANWEDIYFVYFPNDVYELDEQGHREVYQMAARLKKWPDACIELTGYADHTGNTTHNEWLSWNRSNAVVNELINLYGIDPSRIVDRGDGQLSNVEASFGANRRVDMRLVPKADMDSLRSARDEAFDNFQKNNAEANGTKKQSARTQALNAATAAATHSPHRITPYGTKKAEPAKPVEAEPEEEAEEVDDEEEEFPTEPEKSLEERLSEVEITWDTTKYVGAEVTSAKSTLSQFARDYYGNTNCWVYIYEANQELLKSPDYIFPNTKLYFPKLSEEQKKITKEEALAKFAQLKLGNKQE